MNLPISELLRPRIMVKSSTPKIKFEVGEILVFIPEFMHRTDGTINSTTHSDVYKGKNDFVFASEIDEAIESGCNSYMKIPWWQNRKVGDIEYMKYFDVDKQETVVLMVRKYFEKDQSTFFTANGTHLLYSFEQGDEPATKEEFINYNKKQKNGRCK